MNFCDVYPYTVRFEKRFLSGPLSGLAVPQETHWATRDSAESHAEFLVSREHSDVITGDRWTARILP